VLLLGTLPQAHAQQGPGCDFGTSLQRFEAMRQREGLPGAALLLGSRQGLLLEHYTGSYSAQTVVAIASASKLLSAVRILQLSDHGVLDLDAPIGPLLPEFSGDKAGMTLDQLFSHTSGYGNDSGAPEITDRSISLAEAVQQIACCRDFPAGYSVGGAVRLRWSVDAHRRPCGRSRERPGLAAGLAASPGHAARHPQHRLAGLRRHHQLHDRGRRALQFAGLRCCPSPAHE
jgi:hypothetical protein